MCAPIYCETFQSTLPARGATAVEVGEGYQAIISIHAPRTGSDRSRQPSEIRKRKISIHAPRTGSDRSWHTKILDRTPFQSTLPARGATISVEREGRRENNFNPRSPHGERPGRLVDIMADVIISIHAPRTGSDQEAFDAYKQQVDFNPRSPHGERHKPERQNQCVSIFQSTLPARGATLTRYVWSPSIGGFQSTLPARGATRYT